MSLYLIELTGQKPVAQGGAVVTLRYSTDGYVTGPSDTPPNAVYAARVIHPGSYERHLWAAGSVSGTGTSNAGTVELANADGALDALLDWSFDGRAITILRGESASALSAFVTVLRGTLGGLQVTETTVTALIRDRRAEIADKLIVSTRYGGTNALPAGIDGMPNDIKGLPHPLALGEVENVSPVRVNTSAQIFQVSDIGVAAFVNVWSAGAAVTVGVSRANVAALQANAPAAGAYDYSLGSASEGAYFRLGSSPGSSPITCHVQHGATAAARTVGQLATAVLLRAGVSAADILGAAALDAAQPAVVGYYAPAQDTKCGDVLDSLCTSIGAAWTPSRLGKFNLMRVAAPVGLPTVVFNEAQLIEVNGAVVTLEPTTDAAHSVPAYEVDVLYANNFTVQADSSVAGVVTDARRDWLALETRIEKAVNAAVWDPVALTGRDPLSQVVKVRTYLRTQADAQAEAARLLAIYGAGRRLISFVVSSPIAAAVDLGCVIQVASSRFGLSLRLLLCIGLIEDFAADQTTVYAWG